MLINVILIKKHVSILSKGFNTLFVKIHTLVYPKNAKYGYFESFKSRRAPSMVSALCLFKKLHHKNPYFDIYFKNTFSTKHSTFLNRYGLVLSNSNQIYGFLCSSGTKNTLFPKFINHKVRQISHRKF